MNNFKRLTQIEYREKFEKTLFKTFFHNPEWHDFLEKEFKWLKFEYYQYKDEAILPLARFKVFGREKLVSLPFCEYGGPLVLKSGINFEKFETDALSEFGDNIKIKFHPETLKYFTTSNIQHPTSKIQNLKSNIEYPISDTYTNWIENLETASQEQLLDSFRKTLRHEIRDAQNKGVEIKKCSSVEELKQFYKLYITNLKRKKTVPYPFAVFRFLFGWPEAEILLVVLDGKIIGGNLFLNYSKFVHYFFSATDYKYREYGAAYLLLWGKIKSLIGQDKILDLGATPKNSSLDIFKSGWGGKEYPILQIGAKKSPAHAKASADREESLRSSKLRNVWGFLPNFVIKKLSSKLIKYRL